MDPALLAALAAVAAVMGVFLLADGRRRRVLLRRRLVRSFGRAPEDSGPRALTDAWWQRMAAGAPDTAVDERTWQDLDLDAVYTRLNACQSAVGEGYLYAALHLPAGPDTVARRQALADALAGDEGARLAVQTALARTGRKRGGDFSRLLFSPDLAVLPFPWAWRLCAALPLAACCFLWAPWGPGAAIGAMCLNIALCQWAKAKTGRWLEELAYLSRVMAAAGAVRSALTGPAPRTAERLGDALEALRGVRGPLSRFVLAGESAGGADFFLDGLNQIFLLPVLHYLRAAKALRAGAGGLEALFTGLGEVELALCTASFAAGEAVCRPQWLAEHRLEAQDVRHPLLPDAVPNSGCFARCALFTGSNASGKSTFLKALAVNALLAQTMGFCTAGRFALAAGPVPVVSSMAIADDLLAGESYFVAELKSLRRADDGEHFLCFVDEILRGTNTDERLAASQAVLRHLAGTGALCFVATHDGELTTALGDVCDNYHFSETVADGAVVFDYRLRPGPATGRNAIRLLGQMGFPADVVAAARALAGEDRPAR